MNDRRSTMEVIVNIDGKDTRLYDRPAWIKCGEAEPEKQKGDVYSKEVLLTDYWGAYYIAQLFDDGCYKFWRDVRQGDAIPNPFAWMEIPECDLL